MDNAIFWSILAAFGTLCYFAIAWTVGNILRRRRLELEAQQEDNKP